MTLQDVIIIVKKRLRLKGVSCNLGSDLFVIIRLDTDHPALQSGLDERPLTLSCHGVRGTRSVGLGLI